MDKVNNCITCKAKGTSWGVFYLFYINGEFVESCDENERDETFQRLKETYSLSSKILGLSGVKA